MNIKVTTTLFFFQNKFNEEVKEKQNRIMLRITAYFGSGTIGKIFTGLFD
jgi:hypothetical protein